MNVIRHFILCALTGCLAATAMPVLAQNESALVPLPSVSDFARGDGFGAALGAGMEYEIADDGADEAEFEVSLALIWKF